MFRYVATSLLIIISQFSSANSINSPVTFSPYQADYEATWDAGWFPITINASRELSKLDNGLWQLTFEAYSSIADLHESSKYSVVNNTIKPDNYRYKTSGFLSKKTRTQIFNWEKEKTWVADKDHWADYDLTLGIQDNLSYQEQIRLDLLAGKTEFTYQVAYKSRLKEFNFKVANHAKIKTKQGLVNTVEVIRISDNKEESIQLWFATDYEHLLIKLKTKQKNGDTNTIKLKKAKINNQTLLGF